MEGVKDKVLVWFMQNILIPKSEIINNPGFIVLKLTGEKTEISLREILLPEKLIANIETGFVQAYGNQAKKSLYLIGKKFGYNYGVVSKYPTTKKDEPKKIDEFLYFYLRYMEAASFAKNISFETNYELKTYTMKMDRYVVCNLNGLGLILTTGGSAGLWSYILQDTAVEAVQLKCLGLNESNCEVISAPRKYFISNNIECPMVDILEDYALGPNYEKFNAVRQTSFSKKSLKNLIESGFFKFEDSQIKMKNERYVLIESNLIYLIESELAKLDKKGELIFKIGFDYAKKICQDNNINNVISFIMDYFSSAGFGDVLVLKKSDKYLINFEYFPWNNSIECVNFFLLKGLLSGLLSTKDNRFIDLKDPVKEIKRGYLSISFVEK